MRIVIVDGKDGDAIKRMLKNMDSQNACEVAGLAADGKKGYEMIRQINPDLVILDIQLPGTNGLSMLKKLREAGQHCRVIVVTADKDFKRARQAIGLGVDDYLVKPVKKLQLQKAVRNVWDKLADEWAAETALSIESIFMGCLNGQIHPDEKFNETVMERYGFSLEDPGALFSVWLGSSYMNLRERVEKYLKNACRENGIKVCVLSIDAWHLLTAVIYRTGSEKEKRKYSAGGECAEFEIFRNVIVPGLSLSMHGEMLCMWAEPEHLKDSLQSLRELRRIREWNLVFDRGDLIRRQDVEKIQTASLKYPSELENKIRQAVFASDQNEIIKCYYRLYDLLRSELYHPREIKECMIRFNMAVLGAYKVQHQVTSELMIQNSMQRIADAVSWGEIRIALEKFFEVFEFSAFQEETNSDHSPLIQKAVQMVYKYYDQGVTLEEIAEALFVTEEYLSTQFKKETGKGFADTVRQLRIERIKGLLSNTKLKINQIAEMTGYTDPKYMSRVFKEEVGMLPTEFRKTVH